jgi:hypothetical protein
MHRRKVILYGKKRAIFTVKKFVWERRAIFTGSFWDNKECRVFELEGNHGEHVWHLIGIINS